MSESPENLETDPRFPSGRWRGFWVQKFEPVGRHEMELLLTFQSGVITGEGRDWVAPFLIRGRYDTSDGRCYWTKKYLGKHDVFYRGFNEGKGIWGTWEISTWRDGFHVWPEGMRDPTRPELSAEADLPIIFEDEVKPAEPALVPAR
jgi:hypothetical protein